MKQGVYEYKFVKIDLVGFFQVDKRPKMNHYQVIEKHAREGWRLVQIFASSVSVLDGGVLNYFELIFEK